MKQIQKYQLTSNVTELLVSEDTELLRFDYQYGNPTIWVLWGESKKKTTLCLNVMVTGDYVSDEYQYFDTILLAGGGFVAHLFYKNLTG